MPQSGAKKCQNVSVESKAANTKPLLKENGCFSDSANWFANPKKTTWYFTRWPIPLARGLLNREKRKKSLAAYPHPHCSFGEKLNKKSRDASTGATQLPVGLAPVQGSLRLVDQVKGFCFAKLYASVCDNKFPSIVLSLFSWRTPSVRNCVTR